MTTGNYGVRVRSLSGGPKPTLGEVLDAGSVRRSLQAHVSLACDRDGRLWAAWDESGPQWGKDTGYLYQNSPRHRGSMRSRQRARSSAWSTANGWSRRRRSPPSCRRT